VVFRPWAEEMNPKNRSLNPTITSWAAATTEKFTTTDFAIEALDWTRSKLSNRHEVIF